MSRRPSIAPAPEQAQLDNLTLARKEGWQRFVEAPAGRSQNC